MDVDSDLSPDIRDLVVEYCKKRYGVETVANIVTKGFMKPKGAIRNVARIIGAEKGLEDYYLQLANTVANAIQGKANVSFSDVLTDKNETCIDLLRNKFAVKESDTEAEKAKKADIQDLINQAESVENVFLNFGMHAAGVIIADGKPIDNYVPLMKDDKSGDMKIQCDKSQAEDIHGLLKFDFLGLKNLKIVTRCIRSIKSRLGKTIDITSIVPNDKKVFSEIFASGRTGSVFQFESGGMRDMLKKAKPDCFEDLIALVSLYRPGPMDFIPQWIEGKFNKSSIHYLCDELKPILEKTYGTIIYQEQVMDIFRQLAGYSLSGADKVRKYMSKKDATKLAAEKDAFINGDETRGIIGCVKNGIDAKVADELFDKMYSFSSYAFNKSHAAAYSILSYITAYLKYYYTVDYMNAVLNCTDTIEKKYEILNDCKKFNIEIKTPDVNQSENEFMCFSEDGKDIIRFGLNSVKGAKSDYTNLIVSERKENGFFTDLKDFIERCKFEKTTFENLVEAGAMDSLCSSGDRQIARSAIKTAITDLNEYHNKQLKAIQNKTDAENKLLTDETSKRIQNKLKKAIVDLDAANTMFNSYEINRAAVDNKKATLQREKELLGFFVSGSPLDDYKTAKELGFTEIGDIKDTKSESKTGIIEVFGIVQNLKIVQRKSDKKDMAFFDVQDDTGMIACCCFTESYENNGNVIVEDNVVRIKGKIFEDENEDGETIHKLYVEKEQGSIEELEPQKEIIKVKVKDICEIMDLTYLFTKNNVINKNGHQIIFYNEMTSETENSSYFVNEKIYELIPDKIIK